MCLLAYFAPGAEIDERDLFTACANNPDGFGWATLLGGDISVRKSMDAYEAVDSFLSARDLHPESHALFHARYATDGEVSTYNVHPFYVGQGQTSVLAHNGVLPWRPKKGARESDTRMFAERLSAKSIRKLDRPSVRAALGHSILGSKLVILTAKPAAGSSVYIINEDDGHWEGGTWWSNHSYLSYSTRAPLGGWSAWADAGTALTGTECPACRHYMSADDIDVYRMCSACWACLDCERDFAECLCYYADDQAGHGDYMSVGGGRRLW